MHSNTTEPSNLSCFEISSCFIRFPCAAPVTPLLALSPHLQQWKRERTVLGGWAFSTVLICITSALWGGLWCKQAQIGSFHPPILITKVPQTLAPACSLYNECAFFRTESGFFKHEKKVSVSVWIRDGIMETLKGSNLNRGKMGNVRYGLNHIFQEYFPTSNWPSGTFDVTENKKICK